MGVLTAIQRFSLHDGPGIRSTVFFKGCNMRCAWCHNPETLSPAPEVLYYESKCVGCGACAAVCPSHTVVGGKMVYDRSKCDDEGRCAQVCLMGVDVRKSPNSAECIRCGHCSAACPTGAICQGFSRSREAQDALGKHA